MNGLAPTLNRVGAMPCGFNSALILYKCSLKFIVVKTMGLLIDYASLIRPKIDMAISDAMYAWVQPFKDQIDKQSGEYDGGSSRPLLFGHGSYTETITNDSVTIMNITPMQGTWYGVLEVDFVEQGLDNYHMPGARPFMEDAGKAFAEGEGEHILQTYLDSYVH